MKKVISFSLWGEDQKYTLGAIKNAEIAREIYPGWLCRFYIGKSVPKDILHILASFDNTEVFVMNELGDWTGMFWRFYAADDSSIDVMLSRDTDSRLSIREKAAVDQWLSSEMDFHIIRDHPNHRTEILGGLWGAKNNILSGVINKKIHNYVKGNYWQIDQNFLRQEIYPIIKDKAMVHDEFFEKKPFPVKRNGLEFVGEVYDSEGALIESHGLELGAYLNQRDPVFRL